MIAIEESMIVVETMIVVEVVVSTVVSTVVSAVVSAPSEVHMICRILGPEGRMLDEIELVHGTSPNSGVRVGGIGRRQSRSADESQRPGPGE